MIKKFLFTLEAKFWWVIIQYLLLPIVFYNTLMWEGAALNVFLMAYYDIDFSVILRYDLHDWAFGKMTNLPFIFMIERLCDKVGVFELQSIDERVTATTTV